MNINPSDSFLNKSRDGRPLRNLFFLCVFLVYGFFQIYAGYIGIKYSVGTYWAMGAVVVLFVFRFSFPLAVGAFFGAMNIWGWDWLGAFCFAFPGVVISIVQTLVKKNEQTATASPEISFEAASQLTVLSYLRQIFSIATKNRRLTAIAFISVAFSINYIDNQYSPKLLHERETESNEKKLDAYFRANPQVLIDYNASFKKQPSTTPASTPCPVTSFTPSPTPTPSPTLKVTLSLAERRAALNAALIRLASDYESLQRRKRELDDKDAEKVNSFNRDVADYNKRNDSAKYEKIQLGL